MSSFFRDGAGDVAAGSAVNHLTLAEKSKMPTTASLEVLVKIESSLGRQKIDPENSLFKSQET